MGKMDDFFERLIDVSRLSENNKYTDVIDNILNILQEFYNSDWCILRMLDDEKVNLEIIHYTGLSYLEYTSLFRLTTSDYVYKKMVREREPLIVSNLASEPQLLNSVYEKCGIMSFIGYPIVSNDGVIGTIKIYNKKTKRWDEKEIRALKLVAYHLGILLSNLKFVQSYKNDCRAALSSIITLLEIKDKHTIGHSRRVANTAVFIANQLNLSTNEVRNIKIAGLLHDIGKIVIDDHILNKPGILSHYEYSLIKKHPKVGAEVLNAGGFDNYICKIVEQHHERWDGRGYPFGLSYQNICLGARIISVADAFEAMTSVRPYHNAKTYNEAIIELKNCSGKQFCSTVVEAFISIDNSLF